MRQKNPVIRVPDDRSIISPVAAVRDTGGIAIGGKEHDLVAAIGEAVADTAVIDESGRFDRRWAAATEEDNESSRCDSRRGKYEPVCHCSVIIAEAPTTEVYHLHP